MRYPKVKVWLNSIWKLSNVWTVTEFHSEGTKGIWILGPGGGKRTVLSNCFSRLRGLLDKAEACQQSQSCGPPENQGLRGISCWWSRWVIHIPVVTVEEDQKGNLWELMKMSERERKRTRQILIDLHICRPESLKPFHSSTSQVRTLYPHFLYLLSHMQTIDRNWSEARGSWGRVV